MDLVKSINDAILANSINEPRRYIGASSIGRDCSREIWYGYHCLPGEKFPAQLQTTFQVGKRLEGMLIDYVEMTGLAIERPSEENNQLFCQDSEVPSFQGHADALVTLLDGSRAILELKTAKNSSFNRFKNHGLLAWCASYYAQLQSYMGMMGISRGVLLCMNKDTSELHAEWVVYDDVYYHMLRLKAMVISITDEPPERINKSPLYHICANCRYKSVCHNGG